ncbi:MAG: hypothetical protein H0T97_14230 [Actinobacteria bacterium]|nr:hypothetical protein [Actinomycetota bacterium]
MRGRHRYTLAFTAFAVFVLALLLLFAVLIPDEGSDGTLWQLTVVVYGALALALVAVGLTIFRRATRRLAHRHADPPRS